MKILMDTQILIWYQLYDTKLHANIYDLLTRLDNTVYVSQISLVEHHQAKDRQTYRT